MIIGFLNTCQVMRIFWVSLISSFEALGRNWDKFKPHDRTTRRRLGKLAIKFHSTHSLCLLRRSEHVFRRSIRICFYTFLDPRAFMFGM